MTAERLKEIAGRLREMTRFAEDDYVYVSVNARDYEYSVNLGDFGTRTLEVEIQNDEYELDAETVLNKYPIDAYDFRNLADELDEASDEFGGDLDTALARMKENGEGALVSAVKSIVDLFRTTGDTVVDLTGLSIGALPATPLPWPGAMRPGIDYTADDFPMRYQPPPGFGWARDNYDETDVPYTNAGRIPAGAAKGGGQMVMDNKGRVKWDVVGDGDYGDGFRWRLWHKIRDGIPRGRGMGGTTKPRALDRDGTPIAPTTIQDAWGTQERYEEAKARLLAIRAEFENPSQREPNGYGVTYDPLTVEIAAGAARAFTTELRIGDYITGTYGRVVAVEEQASGLYLVVSNRDGVIRRDLRALYNWQIRPVIGVDRAAQPTALEATQPMALKYGYDPVTIETGDRLQSVRTDELRAGDDVTPGNFGRVLSAKPVEGDPTRAMVMFDLNGTPNERSMVLRSTWTLLPVAGGVNRDELPTVVSTMEDQPGAPQQEEPQPMVDYDPLTIPVDNDVEILVLTSELRLGDDVIGSRWGRVTKVNPDFSFEMNRDGTINTYTPGGDVSWSIHPIDVADRDEVPTAYSLASAPAEIAF